MSVNLMEISNFIFYALHLRNYLSNKRRKKKQTFESLQIRLHFPANICNTCRKDSFYIREIIPIKQIM